MLNYKNTRLVFVIALLAILGMVFFTGASLWWVWLVIFIYSLFLFYGSYNINSNFYMPAICKGATTKNQIAITFDDGPATYTLEILKILEAYNTKATFFCIGNKIGSNSSTLEQIHHAGHNIGNHSYHHHFWLDIWPVKKVYEDLQQTHHLIKNTIGVEVRWFRPPFGVTNPNIAKAVKQMGYETIGWSIRSLDTVTKEPEALLQKVLAQLHPGAIILFHDTCAVTVATLPLFIKKAVELGYEILPLHQLLDIHPYQ